MKRIIIMMLLILMFAINPLCYAAGNNSSVDNDPGFFYMKLLPEVLMIAAIFIAFCIGIGIIITRLRHTYKENKKENESKRKDQLFFK